MGMVYDNSIPTLIMSFGKNIEGPVWYTIYHHSPVLIGANKPFYKSTNQWDRDIYDVLCIALFANYQLEPHKAAAEISKIGNL